MRDRPTITKPHVGFGIPGRPGLRDIEIVDVPEAVWTVVKEDASMRALVFFGFSLKDVSSLIDGLTFHIDIKFLATFEKMGSHTLDLVEACYRANNWWSRGHAPRLAMERFALQKKTAVVLFVATEDITSKKTLIRKALPPQKFHRSVHATDCLHETLDILSYAIWEFGYREENGRVWRRAANQTCCLFGEVEKATWDCELEHRQSILFGPEPPDHLCERPNCLMVSKRDELCNLSKLHAPGEGRLSRPRLAGLYFRALAGRLALELASRVSRRLTFFLRETAVNRSRR